MKVELTAKHGALAAALVGVALVSSYFLGGRSSSPTSSPVSANAAVAAPAPNALGDSYQNIVDQGVVRIGVLPRSKPFYHVDQGQPRGFNYDFLKILFAQSEFTSKNASITLDTDHEAETYPGVPEALLKKDNRGKPTVDIALDGLTFADDDLPGVVYTIPYVSDFGYALITTNRSPIKGVADLKNKTIGVIEGDPDVKAYVERQFPDSTVRELKDSSTGDERTWTSDYLKSGKVDAIVYDYPFAAAEIAGTTLRFAVAKLPNSDIKYKIAVRKEDRRLLEMLNIAIRKARDNPDYLGLLKTYFTSKNLGQVRAAADSEVNYTVKPGDTLASIASALLGNSKRFSEIEARNNLPNPDLIHVGQTLVIPKF